MAKSNPNKVPISRKRARSPSGPTATPTELPKRPRQYTALDLTLAGIYERLADPASDVRLAAAKDLLTHFAGDKINDSEEVDKALKRLIRGLCSGRKAARYGFFVALVEMVRMVYGEEKDDVKELVSLVVDLTKPDGKVMGMERRDHYFGRLYAAKAVIESGVIATGLQGLEVWTEIVSVVCKLAIAVPFLREECGMMLVEAIKTVEKMELGEKFVRTCLEILVGQGLGRSPEGVAVWITIQSTFPEFTKFPECWQHNDPLHADNRSLLKKAMKEQYEAKEENGADGRKIKSGYWQQTVHSAWDVVLERAIAISRPEEEAEQKEDEPNKFKSIWRGLVDDVLFNEKSSLERKFWGFQLLSNMFKAAPSWALSYLFQPNSLYYLINNQSSENKMLHEAASDSIKKLKARAKDEPDSADKLIKGLVARKGTVFFDRLTKTKTLEEIMALSAPDAFCRIIEVLETVIQNQKGKEEKDAENARQAATDLLLNSLKSKIKDSVDSRESKKWIKKLLTVLTTYAYCKPRSANSKIQPEISEKSRSVFQSRLSSCIGHILTEKPKVPSRWPWYVVNELQGISKSSESFELVLDADDQVQKTIKEACRTAKQLSKQTSDGESSGVTDAIVLLFSLSLLQAYSGDPNAISLLDDLVIFYGSNSEEIEGRSDLVLEILLSFISKPSSLHRNMAVQVFTAISEQITEEGLQSLIAIMEQPESLAGQQELFNEAGEGDDGEESDDSDEMDSDVEMVDAGAGAESSSEDEEEEGEDTDPEAYEAPDQELVDFESKLAEALKTSRDAVDLPDASSDDESMDDEQMIALEPKLAHIFQQRRLHGNKNKEKRDAKENIINFKRRVLDLLTIYARQESTNPLALHMILPLLALLRTSSEKSLREKAAETLKTLYTTCQKSKSYPSPQEETLELLKNIHAEVQRKTNNMHSTACSRASLFVVRVLVLADAKSYEDVVAVYGETQSKWFQSPKVTIQPTFFTEFVSWSNEFRKEKNKSKS